MGRWGDRRGETGAGETEERTDGETVEKRDRVVGRQRRGETGRWGDRDGEDRENGRGGEGSSNRFWK